MRPTFRTLALVSAALAVAVAAPATAAPVTTEDPVGDVFSSFDPSTAIDDAAIDIVSFTAELTAASFTASVTTRAVPLDGDQTFVSLDVNGVPGPDYLLTRGGLSVAPADATGGFTWLPTDCVLTASPLGSNPTVLSVPSSCLGSPLTANANAQKSRQFDEVVDGRVLQWLDFAQVGSLTFEPGVVVDPPKKDKKEKKDKGPKQTRL